jgi:hypothetical protein
VNTSPDEESHPVLLPGVDMLNRQLLLPWFTTDHTDCG